MADLTLLRLGREDVEGIVARMIRDVVMGLDPTDPSYPDIVGGTFLHDLYGAVSLELDRIYDRVNVEMPRTALPHLTYGEWLDAWAEVLGVGNGAGGFGRRDEVKATGEVRFTISATAPGPVTIPLGTRVSTEAATDDEDDIEFATLEEIVVAAGASGTASVEALEAGVAGNVPANSITLPVSQIGHVESVTNLLAMSSGDDVESDERLQQRIATRLGGVGGPGNDDDYIGWGLEEPGVGFVTVQRNWAGVTTVRMLLRDPDNNPVGQPIIDRVQGRVDPLDGSGGLAPIGAVVTVATPTALLVTVNATIEPEPGYSVTGTAGTTEIGPAIEAAIRAYVEALPPGAEIVRHKIIGAIVSVTGVHDAVLNTPAADVQLTGTQVPQIAVGGVTLA